MHFRADLFPRIEILRESEVRFKKSKRGRDLSRRSFLSRHSLASVCFFPPGEFSSRSVGNVSRFSRVALLHTGPESLRSAPLFSFSLLPPWRCFSLYLSNNTTDYSESLFHFPTIHPFAALAYSRPRALCTSIIRAVSLPALAYPRNN